MFRSFVTILALSCLPPAAAAQDRLASVQVKGNQRYAAEDVIKLSGLQIGKTVSQADLTAAANHMAATGLFHEVRYRYTTGAGQISVTFEVQEAAWSIPLTFDNFVGISDEELTKAVRNEVPSFDGTMPINAGAAEFIAAAVQKTLALRGVPGHVEITPRTALVGSSQEAKVLGYVAAVKDPAPKVCALHVSGASAVPEKDLTSQLADVVGGDYSRSFFEAAANGTLRDVYRRRGYWRAAFDTPSAATGQCAGVTATLTVNEGVKYAWDGASWNGTTVFSKDALDGFMGLKPGDLADMSRIDVGLRRLNEEYGKHGYVVETATYEPKLDDARQRAAFEITVSEGPQYHMGTFAVSGVTDKDAATLTKKWPLKMGDVFDMSAARKYEGEVLSPLRAANGTRPVAQLSYDRDKRLVNVAVVLR